MYKKSFDFAINIIDIYKYLVYSEREYIMSKQLLRSGTSIGANMREAKYSQSDKDYLHKITISLKEASETEYWLKLLIEGKFLDRDIGNQAIYKCKELKTILLAIVKKLRNKIELNI